ncbi:MAG: hypothetical protein ACFB0G_11320 [Leptolyngbyaceae cyanobacterium]
MTWNGTLITLKGANEIFSGQGLQITHNDELGIYECHPASESPLRAKTLVGLCKQIIDWLAAD